MRSTEVLQIATAAAADLPEVTKEHPFGPEWDVYKVAGKVFLLTTEVPGEPIVTLKCEPEHGRALQQQYRQVVPGYHMNKQHWLSIRAGDDVPPDLVEELVGNSYGLVVEGLPRAKRPTGVRST